MRSKLDVRYILTRAHGTKGAVVQSLFGEREIGPATAGTLAARSTASEDRTQPQMCAADAVGRLRTELASGLFDYQLGPDLTKQYVAEFVLRGWTCERGAWVRPATDPADRRAR